MIRLWAKMGNTSDPVRCRNQTKPGRLSQTERSQAQVQNLPAQPESCSVGDGRIVVPEGNFAVFANVVFELLAELREGAADAARPSVLGTELLPGEMLGFF